MKATFSICLALLLGAVAGRSLSGPTKRDLTGHIAARQLPPPSPDCTVECSVYSNAVSTCSDDACMCTNEVAEGLADCLNCEIALGPGAAGTAGPFLQDFLDNCASNGFILNPQVLQGQGTVTTIAPAGTSVISAEPSTSGLSTTQTLLASSSSASSQSTTSLPSSTTAITTSATPITTSTTPITTSSLKSTTSSLSATTSSIRPTTSRPPGSGAVSTSSGTPATSSGAIFSASNSTSSSGAATSQGFTDESVLMAALFGLCGFIMMYAF